MKKRNHLTTSHFGGGNSVISGLASIFHTSTKRRLLSCAKAIIAVFFALFATGCTRYEYINLTDEDEESAPIDTTTRGNQGSSFDFDTCDSEPIEVELNPGYDSPGHSTEVKIRHDFSNKSYDCEKNVLLSPFKIGKKYIHKEIDPINKDRTNGTVTI